MSTTTIDQKSDLAVETDTLEDTFKFEAELNGSHRCDACGARAVSQVLMGSTLMLFCGHHHRANKVIFDANEYPYRVPDEEDVIFTVRFNDKKD